MALCQLGHSKEIRAERRRTGRRKRPSQTSVWPDQPLDRAVEQLRFVLR